MKTTKNEIIAAFREEMMPGLRRIEQEQTGKIDYALRTQAWHMLCSALHEAGRITDAQAASWTVPDFCTAPAGHDPAALPDRECHTHRAQRWAKRSAWWDAHFAKLKGATPDDPVEVEIEWHEDASHAWLEVPWGLLWRLGAHEHITPLSFRWHPPTVASDDSMCFLEEGDDAATFLMAAEKQLPGVSFVTNKHWSERSFIRGFHPFWITMEAGMGGKTEAVSGVIVEHHC